MSNIYKFIGFETFVDIVQRKALAFVKPEKWEDPYESYTLKALKTEQGKKDIASVFDSLGVQHHGVIEIVGELYFGQCWTRTPESDAFWRIYSFNNRSIRIEVDTEKINLIKSKVSLNDVMYVDSLNLKDELLSIIDKETVNMAKVFLTKRKSFVHENEVRLLFLNTKYLDEHCDVVHIPFDGIDNFIKSVMVNPLAPEWFNETVKNYCHINSLNYLGKSDLYSLKIL